MKTLSALSVAFLLSVLPLTMMSASGPDSTNATSDAELASFEAHRIDSKAELKWMTTMERNIDHFEIQRSVDNESWITVMNVSGAGSSSQAVEYFDIDYQAPSSRIFYRLKNVGLDGSISYSTVTVVPAANELDATEERLLKSFPNSVTPGSKVNLTFDNPAEKDMILVLRAVTGQEYFAKVDYEADSEQYLVVDASSSIPAGNYIITATSQNDVYSSKLIVE